MKRILIAFAVVVLGSLMACNSEKTRQEKVQKVAEKVVEGQKFTQDEYTEAFNYLEEAYKELEDIRNDTNRSMEHIMARTEEWNRKYADAQAMKEVYDLEPADLDSANMARYRHLKQVIEASEARYPVLKEDGVKEIESNWRDRYRH